MTRVQFFVDLERTILRIRLQLTEPDPFDTLAARPGQHAESPV